MRRYIFLFLLLPLLTVRAYGLPQEVLDALPNEARVLLEETPDDTTEQNLQGGLERLLERGGELAGQALTQATGPAVAVMVISILCSMCQSVYRATDSEKAPDLVPFVGVLAVTAATAVGIESMVGLAQQTIGQLHVFSQALLPALAAAVSSAGGLITASVQQLATVWLSGVLISLIDQVLFLLVYCYIALSAAHTMAPKGGMKAMAEALKKGITYLLSGAVVLFTGFLSLSGALTGSSDSLTASLTRSAIATAVPVVGSIISEAGNSILAGATVLKNTLGIGGMLGVVAVCLAPFITLGVQYLLFKLAAFFCDMLGAVLSEYVQALGSAFGLVLGMVGTCALVLLVSVGASIAAVVP